MFNEGFFEIRIHYYLKFSNNMNTKDIVENAPSAQRKVLEKLFKSAG